MARRRRSGSCRTSRVHYPDKSRSRASRGQVKESIQFFRGIETHDESLQFFALILADDIATKCREFHGDFLLGHRVARIALGNIDPRGVWLAVIGGDSHTARLE